MRISFKWVHSTISCTKKIVLYGYCPLDIKVHNGDEKKSIFSSICLYSEFKKLVSSKAKEVIGLRNFLYGHFNRKPETRNFCNKNKNE